MRAVGARRGEERSLRGAIIPADRVQSITPRVAFRQTRCVKNTPLMNLLTEMKKSRYLQVHLHVLSQKNILQLWWELGNVDVSVSNKSISTVV